MTLRWISAVIVLSLFISSCSLFSSATDDSNVVGVVDNEPIYYDELMEAYQGSSDAASPALEEEADDADLLEFLDLYIDYRTKLAVAKENGLLESEEMQQQLKEYQRQTAYPYWLERRVRDQLLDELVERQSEEINASHILIAVDEDASPADTADAYEQLMEARNQHLEDGIDFEQLNQQYSSRQQGQPMGGDLGYFSGGMMIKAFEDVAFNTPVDSVSKPFRTQFGYHILKVNDRQEPEPERNISHIFWNTRQGEITVDEALDEAAEVYESITTGNTEWREAVERYSQDPQSADQDGNVGWVTVNDFNETFTDTLLALEESGSMAEPFYSEYGVHILRLDSIRTYESDEELREELYERLQQLPRYRENREAVLRTIRNEAGEQIFQDTRTAVNEVVEQSENTSIADMEWPEELKGEALYEINSTVHTAGDFLEWLRENHGEEEYHYAMMDDFFDDAADDEVIPLTAETFPEFTDISEQYLHGLAVFQINEDSLWNYARQDTQAVKRHFEENETDYEYPTRYRYTRFSAHSDSLLQVGLDLFDDGMEPDSINSKVEGLVAQTDVTQDLEGEPLEHLEGLEEGSRTEQFTWRSRPTVLHLHEIKEPRRMTFEEAYNRVASDYQPIREEQWLQKMRARYEAEAFPERLQSLKSENDQ